MKKITINTDHSITKISPPELASTLKTLEIEIERAHKSQNSGYESEYASINLLSDTAMVHEMAELAEEKLRLNPTLVIVIGIGGSNLGTLAIHEAVSGLFYNEQGRFPRIYFVDTVDTDAVSPVYNQVKKALENNETVLINVVTKSGTTTETIVNFELFLELVKTYCPTNYQESIIVTTDEGSVLWNYAKKESFATLKIPKNVGGRFSVFSSVGLFPLCLLGIDIQELLEGARVMLEQCLSVDLANNPAALSAAIQYICYHNKIRNHDMFLFSKDLNSLGTWYRQLIGESIGKKFDREGHVVYIGITPTVSIGSTDLHSVAQLYLSGPRTMFTTFVSIATTNSCLAVPQMKEFEDIVANIQGKSLPSIMSAIFEGTCHAYQLEQRPFMTVLLPDKSCATIGQFLQWKMVEIMYLGYLLGVNPFDQPQVELYKTETRKILSNE